MIREKRDGGKERIERVKPIGFRHNLEALNINNIFPLKCNDSYIINENKSNHS